MTTTTLTPAQQGRLQGMAVNNEEAKVVAWDVVRAGPVVVLENGQRITVTPRGRKIPH